MQSNTVTTVKKSSVEKLIITKQPENQILNIGETAIFKIEVTGGKDNKYQWYKQEGNNPWFGKIYNATSNIYQENLGESYDFEAKYYCIVTSADGQKVQSDTVTTLIK